MRKGWTESVVNGEGVAALLALVEDGAALVDGSSLHDIVFKFGVVALGTSFLDDHFGLASVLAVSATLVLAQPLFAGRNL